MNIFSIFTCQAHKDRIEFMEEAWIPRDMPRDSKMYYVYGNAKEAYEDGRNLFLPCHESYEYLLDKTYHTLKYILEMDFDYFIGFNYYKFILQKLVFKNLLFVNQFPNFIFKE